MTAVAMAYKVWLRCTGKRKNGELCDQLLAKIDAEFVGTIQIKCTRCGTVVEFR